MMKKINNRIAISGIVIFLLTIFTSYAVYAGGMVFHLVDNSGLVLDMNLSKDNYSTGSKVFSDNSATRNNGTSVNAVTFTTDNNNKNSGAMTFNGSSDYVQLSTNHYNYISVGAWFKTTNKSLTQRIISKTEGGEYQISLNENSACGAGKLCFLIHDGVNYFPAAVDISSVINNTWQYVLGTYDGETVKLYLDGVLVSSNTSPSGVMKLVTNPICIGSEATANSCAGGAVFSGAITGVKIFNRALSAVEAQALYDSGKSKMSTGSNQAGLIAYWPLDGDSYNLNNNKVTDKTPYEHTGTNYGATLTSDRFGQTKGAMSFNGAGNYINVGTGNKYFPLPLFSICAWAKSPGLGAGMSTNGIISLTYGLSFSLDASGQFWSRMDNGTSFAVVTVPGNLYDNQFHHLCLTYDGANRYMFVDGVLKNTTATTWLGTTRWPTDSVNIGHENNNPPVYKFNGSISGVRIYNRALSASEIDTLFDGYKAKVSAGSLHKGLVLDLPLSSKWTKSITAGSQIMTDKTPYSIDGKNYGGTVGADSTSFNGTNNYMTVGGTSSLGVSDEMSLFAWVKVPSGIGDAIRIGNIIGKHPNAPVFNMEGHTLGRLRVYWNGGEKDIYATGFDMRDNKWHLVGFTRNLSANTFQLYVDGVPNISTTAGTSVNFLYPLKIGDDYRNGSSPGIPFNGSIAGIKIYNRSLAAEEVKLLYDKGR